MRRYSRVRLLRVLAAAAVFFLFHLTLFAGGTAGGGLLRVLSRLQLLPAALALFGAGLGWYLLSFLLIFGGTLVLGRIYCSVLCPLGILQDIFIFFSGKLRRKKFRRLRPRRIVHFSTAVAACILFLLGIPLFLNLLEPFAFWGRIERDLILPVFSALSYLAAEGAKLLDFYMTPIPFFGRLPVVSLTALLFSALLVLTLLRGRWFCNHLCPTGALLRAPLTAGSLPLLRVRAQIDACTRCGVCEKVCKTGSIAVDRQGVKVDHETCVVCFNCLSSCPFGAMGYSTGGREKSKGRQIGEGRTAGEERRSFLKRGAGIFGSLLAGFSFLSMGRSFEGAGTPRRGAAGPGAGVVRLRKKTPLGEPNTPATPPGSVSIDRFRRKCISCHRCVSVCPTHVLQPSLFEYGPGGFMQPVMDYATGYCEYECVACLSVCPVGAILPLSPEEKQKTQIGRVHFIEDRCIVFSDGTACGACAEVCPSGAVIMIPYTDELTQPQTDNDICVGCGSCEFSCPVTGGKAIYVKGNEVHVEREVRKPEKSGPVQAEPEDFPF